MKEPISWRKQKKLGYKFGGSEFIPIFAITKTTTMFQDFYYKQLTNRLFSKNNQEYPKFGVGGLRYRSEHSLKTLLSLELGDSAVINNSIITRVQ